MKNTYELPLFPLNVVVCPNGFIQLRIFEARYLDMVRSCLRNKSAFAIVTVFPEGETHFEGDFPFTQVGTLLKIIEADVTTVGLIMVRCVGQHRVKIHTITKQSDGLIIGQVEDLPNELVNLIPDDLKGASDHLKQLIKSVKEQGINEKEIPILEPYQLEDATWVSNRWVELLDLSLLEKYRLMKLESPILRLELVSDILESNSKKIS